MSKGICLVSGGLDSSLALVKLLEEAPFPEVSPLFVDFNQWPVKEEWIAVQSLCRRLGSGKHQYRIAKPIYLRISLGDDTGVGSVWGRNIALVGIAAMWAYTHGDNYDFIALGTHKGDVGPDCAPGAFDTHLNMALMEGTKSKLQLLLPIRDLTTGDIGIELRDYGIPFSLLANCFWSPPCGYKSPNEEYRCPGCRRKIVAMKAAGIEDEWSLKNPNFRNYSYQRGYY